MKSSYQYLRTAWKKPSQLPRYKEMLRRWRTDDVIKRIEKPTRLDRAHALGYKAKQGYILARVRIGKGGRHRPKIRKGRRPKRLGRIYFTTRQSHQSIAEKRVARNFPNLEALNSYYVGEDGQYKYFEVILVDPHHPVILADPKINWIARQRRRAFRGLTSAAKKSR